MNTFAAVGRLKVVLLLIPMGASAWAQALAPAPPPPPLPPSRAQLLARPRSPALLNPTNPVAAAVQPRLLPAPPAASLRPAAPPPPVSTPPSIGPLTPANALVFDADSKEFTTKSNELSTKFVFHLTNTSTVNVSVHNVHTSCGCTVAKLPATPWVLKPGDSGPIEVAVDLRGKRGVLTKSLNVQTSSGVKSLLIRVNIPDQRTGLVDDQGGLLDPDRQRNIALSLANRQAVFTDRSCAVCHADKAAGKLGKELYDLACAICHDTPHRATMVTDLKLKNPGLEEGWRQWILYGRTNSLMPAFAKAHGGILSPEQVESLVDYLVRTMPPVPQFSGPASTPPGVVPVVMAPNPIAMPPALPSPPPRLNAVSLNPMPPAIRPPPPPPPTAPAVPDPPATPINPFTFPKDN